MLEEFIAEEKAGQHAAEELPQTIEELVARMRFKVEQSGVPAK